jgi:hypothetical protein
MFFKFKKNHPSEPDGSPAHRTISPATHIIMKRIFVLLLASLCVSLHSSSADDARAGQSIMMFQGQPASQVLGIYEQITGREFIIDSRAKAVSLPITLKLINSPPLSKEETVKQMRQALLTQAGIVITQLDTSRESVTYNDALPLAITIDFGGVPDVTLIDLYQQLTGLELTRDPSARISRNPITLHPDAPLAKKEAIKLLEKTLLAQAGIVIKRIDDKHALLTRKDVLETTH